MQSDGFKENYPKIVGHLLEMFSGWDVGLRSLNQTTHGLIIYGAGVLFSTLMKIFIRGFLAQTLF